ncbi:MAG TPA: RIP metalloprotease RseP [Myxococcota bacterium]|nr:RIP metalloprotease RseP [Myxococcota bacterium]
MNIFERGFEIVFAFVLLLSILIFVHELGHFLVARACGVRVLKFSIGFGPPIRIGRFQLAWKRNGTEYVIAWFPLGGFVKMLGENPDEVDDPEALAHPAEALGSQPLWQKLAIVFAGPVMNLVLPVFVFMVTLAIGVPNPESVIGSIEPGSPAARAGLVPGDRVTQVGDEKITWWGDFEEAVRLRPGEELPVQVARSDGTRELTLAVEKRATFDELGQPVDAGWVGAGFRRVASMLGIPSADSPAFAAGLRSGDVVKSVGSSVVESWEDLASAYAAAGSAGTVRLQVERAHTEASASATAKPESLELEVPALASLEALGAVPANVVIERVVEGAPAEQAGLRTGDLILSVDGAALGSFMTFEQTVRTSQGRPLEIDYARDGALAHVTLTPRVVQEDVGLGIKEPRYRVGIVPRLTSLQGAVGLDRERNPVEAFPRAVGMTVDFTRSFLKGLGMIVTGQVSRNQIAGPIGIAEIADSAMQQGWHAYLMILVVISINLGILNLLPIPILDGGQALLFTIEALRRGPLSLRTREIVQQLGFTVLILIMGLAFWNDLSRQWVRVLEWLKVGPS